MARRVKANEEQRCRLFAANASRCCVCKRSGIGLHLHHINGNPSDTVDENLAVLCVEDHDRHHRPSSYHIRMLSGVLRRESPAVDSRPALSTSDSTWLD